MLIHEIYELFRHPIKQFHRADVISKIFRVALLCFTQIKLSDWLWKVT